MSLIIKKIPLKDKISTILMQEIIDGNIKVGDRIKEAYLAKRFGVSQSPIREAIVSLVELGILEHIPNIGTSVKKHTNKEVVEFYQVREALEIYALKHINKFPDLKLIKYEYDEMIKATKKNDIKKFVMHDQLFHELLLQNLDNCLILKLWRQQYTKSSLLNNIEWNNFKLEDVISIHHPIIKAIKEQSSIKFIKAISNHYNVIITNIRNKK